MSLLRFSFTTATSTPVITSSEPLKWKYGCKQLLQWPSKNPFTRVYCLQVEVYLLSNFGHYWRKHCGDVAHFLFLSSLPTWPCSRPNGLQWMRHFLNINNVCYNMTQTSYKIYTVYFIAVFICICKSACNECEKNWYCNWTCCLNLGFLGGFCHILHNMTKSDWYGSVCTALHLTAGDPAAFLPATFLPLTWCD